MTKAELFFNELKNKKVAVIGVGVSHSKLIPLLAQKGIQVTVCDKRDIKEIEEAKNFIPLGVKFKTGEDYLKEIDADVIFRTPGMYFGNPYLTEYRNKGVAVTSETEVFFDLCPCKIFAVTGSDGKTTTTTLISKMLEAEGKKVFLGGNIGKPLLTQIFDITENDVAVVELSSFQLMSMRTSPDVAVITNVSPNHLDIHKDMEEYIDCKRNLFAHQNAFSKTVLNLDNEITYSFSPEIRGSLSYFSMQSTVENGCFVDKNDDIYAIVNGSKTFVMNASQIRIPGRHNVENYLAAISAVWGFVSLKSIVTTAETFGGVEHRIEFVREYNGVKWYNDSIASSPTRTIAGLKSFNKKICVIAGGYDKNIPYAPLGEYINKYVKLLILMGKTAPKIEEATVKHPDYNPCEIKILFAEDMEEAVLLAKENTLPGDVVSLSPASASFDLYRNFEARGEHFKSIVLNLK